MTYRSPLPRGIAEVLVLLLSLSGVIARRSYLLGGLFPLTGQISSGPQRGAAALLAVDHINRDIFGDFPGSNFTLEIIVNDTRTFPGDGTSMVIRQLTGTWSGPASTTLLGNDYCTASNTVPVGVVGAASSSVSTSVSHVAGAFRLPQISYSSTSTELSNKVRHPYFCRVVSPDNAQAEVLARMIGHYNWTRVAVIHSNDDYGNGFATNFLSAAVNITVASVVRIEPKPSASEVASALLSIKNTQARIIVVFTIVGDARAVLLKARQLGMDGSAGYVWLGVDGWLSDSLVSRSEVLAAGYTVQELSDLRSIAVGSLGTVPRSVQGARRTRLLTEWEIHQAELEMRMGAKNGSFAPPLNLYTPFAYEAVYAYAKALYALELNNSQPSFNGTSLLRSIQALRYEGVTGLVAFDDSCDRELAYDIVNIQSAVGTTLTLTVTSQYDASTSELVPVSAVVFGDGSTTPPPDAPVKPVDDDIPAAVAGVVFALATVQGLVTLVLAVLLYMLKDRKLIRGSTVASWNLSFVGLAISVAIVPLHVVRGGEVLRCHLVWALSSVGFTMIFAPIMGRIYRLHFIFSQALRNRKLMTRGGARAVSTNRIIIGVLLLALLMCSINVVRYLVDSGKFIRVDSAAHDFADVSICSHNYDWLFLTLTIIINSAILLCCGYFAFSIWNLGKPGTSSSRFAYFNESRGVLHVVCVTAMTLVIMGLVSTFLDNHLTFFRASMAVGVFILAMDFMLVLMVPKLYAAWLQPPEGSKRSLGREDSENRTRVSMVIPAGNTSVNSVTMHSKSLVASRSVPSGLSAKESETSRTVDLPGGVSGPVMVARAHSDTIMAAQAARLSVFGRGAEDEKSVAEASGSADPELSESAGDTSGGLTLQPKPPVSSQDSRRYPRRRLRELAPLHHVARQQSLPLQGHLAFPETPDGSPGSIGASPSASAERRLARLLASSSVALRRSKTLSSKGSVLPLGGLRLRPQVGTLEPIPDARDTDKTGHAGAGLGPRSPSGALDASAFEFVSTTAGSMSRSVQSASSGAAGGAGGATGARAWNPPLVEEAEEDRSGTATSSAGTTSATRSCSLPTQELSPADHKTKASPADAHPGDDNHVESDRNATSNPSGKDSGDYVVSVQKAPTGHEHNEPPSGSHDHGSSCASPPPECASAGGSGSAQTQPHVPGRPSLSTARAPFLQPPDLGDDPDTASSSHSLSYSAAGGTRGVSARALAAVGLTDPTHPARNNRADFFVSSLSGSATPSES